MRRGEISMEVIIIAAGALRILVILSVRIIRSGGRLAVGTSCQALQGGVCDSSCDGYTDSAGRPYVQSSNACPQQGDVCCRPLDVSN